MPANHTSRKRQISRLLQNTGENGSRSQSGFTRTKSSQALVLPEPGMDKNTWVGLIASILTTLAALPQLVKIFKDKKAENISLLWIVILILGLSGWIYYGFLRKDIIILISNSIGVLINLILAVYAIRYKRSNP